MTAGPNVSVIIVSRGRPVGLKRALTSLRYLDFPNFEVIVVSNAEPKALFPEIHNIDQIKFVPFDKANISAARNLGINQASGEIVAFCDDDAVPEPTWLSHLTAPFKDQMVAAAGGYVRGRNGISFQWRGRSFDRFGDHSDLEIEGDAPVVLSGDAKTGIKTEGTNCAFRKQVLLDLGGFDEGFRYYLDETDLNMRIGQAGWKTAIVPLAQVHHGFAASSQRTQNRAPKSLFDLGQSKALFCRKHAQFQEVTSILESFTRTQKNRLMEFMLRGDIEPRDVPHLLSGLADGLRQGATLTPQKTPKLADSPKSEFQSYLNLPVGQTAIACRAHQWRKAFRVAKTQASQGRGVTVFQFSLSSIYHRIVFHPEGFWLHKGGIFGRAERCEPLFQPNTLKSRTTREVVRLGAVRPITKTFSIRDLP
ncbi:MAG: glycosyltransferase [Alphaproteobacteria bacterium]|nr:glycosyltransferase [Alphaproteobacteria bacterium]